MTYRESRLRRAEQLRMWADSADNSAAAHLAAARHISDSIPLGQPILVGHHSEKRMRRAYEYRDSQMFAWLHDSERAAAHRERAASIEYQASRSVYTDDHDAIERLEERLAAAEARHARIKAYNARARRGDRSTAGLTEDDVRDLISAIRADQSPDGTFPSYILANLSAEIRRLRQRIEQVRTYQQQHDEANSSSTGCTITTTENGRLRLTFAEKPDRCILDDLRAAGWRWYQRSWWGEPGTLPESVRTAYHINS